MTDRRDFMGYIGTGAIGSMVGYYVAAKELLGIQSGTKTPETETPPRDAATGDRDAATGDRDTATRDRDAATRDRVPLI